MKYITPITFLTLYVNELGTLTIGFLLFLGTNQTKICTLFFILICCKMNKLKIKGLHEIFM